MSPLVGGDHHPHASQPRWRQWAGRLSGYGWLALRVALALALVGGLIYAAAWQPRSDDVGVPPCFGGGGLPGTRDLPVVVNPPLAPAPGC